MEIRHEVLGLNPGFRCLIVRETGVGIGGSIYHLRHQTFRD